MKVIDLTARRKTAERAKYAAMVLDTDAEARRKAKSTL